MAERCPRTVQGSYGTYPWPCTLAAGHQGGCEPQIDARYYTAPLEQMPAPVLASELRSALHRAETTRIGWERDTVSVRRRLSNVISRLEALTAGNRKTIPAADVRRVLEEALQDVEEES